MLRSRQRAQLPLEAPYLSCDTDTSCWEGGMCAKLPRLLYPTLPLPHQRSCFMLCALSVFPHSCGERARRWGARWAAQLEGSK